MCNYLHAVGGGIAIYIGRNAYIEVSETLGWFIGLVGLTTFLYFTYREILRRAGHALSEDIDD
jgi:hypothetical protein